MFINVSGIPVATSLVDRAYVLEDSEKCDMLIPIDDIVMISTTKRSADKGEPIKTCIITDKYFVFCHQCLEYFENVCNI